MENFNHIEAANIFMASLKLYEGVVLAFKYVDGVVSFG